MKNESIYRLVIHGERGFYYCVILLEIITYTFSFLISGLAKKDIFNLLEGKSVTMGIYSFSLLIVLNITIPLLINCMKQINSGLVAKIEIRLKRNIKQKLYDNVFQEKPGISCSRGYGETVSLFRNECEDMVSYLMEYYYQLPKIFLSIAILIVMACINPVFAIISIVPTFGMVLLIKFLEKHIVANREAARKSASEITTYLENLFGNVDYFKLAADSDKLGNIFEKKCKKRARNEIRDRVLDKVLSVISENSAGLVMGIVLLVAIPLYRRNLFSVGEFVMFEYYYAFLTSLPDAVGKLIRRHKQSMVAADRLQVMECDTYHGNAEYGNGELKVNVEYLDRKYTVKVSDRNIVLIKGGNESERSILLQRLFQVCLEHLKGLKCSYVPGQPVLLNDSVMNNICIGEPYSEEKMRQVLLKTDLAADIAEFEDGIEKKVGKHGGAVSGGQKKRISIARALYEETDLLFLDGLSEAVDIKTEQIMISNILENPEGIIFVASDSESLLGKASQIIDIAC
ncbi:MAG: ABC transporter ATP-binding protein [Lachnospiraceae bacterium]|nr:ABC transporter ATP-binding protein [Lachnospiraceae bacterium]